MTPHSRKPAHAYAIFIAIFALFVIVSGAYITSSEVAAREAQVAVAANLHQFFHQIAGTTLGLLLIVLAVWLRVAGVPRRLTAATVVALSLFIFDAALAMSSNPISAPVAAVHAILAHAMFAMIVLIVVATSAGWNREPHVIDCSARPLLRPVALAIPWVVIVQISLGAAYRHDLMGIISHMGTAMIVALLALTVCAVILQNYPGPRELRRAATLLISAVIAQICLGIAAFLMLVLGAAGSLAFIIVTVGHVSIGSLTLGASIYMAMETSRSIAKKSPASV